MRKAVTLRMDPALLAEVRKCAKLENRTMTNFIETAVKHRVAVVKASDPGPFAQEPSSCPSETRQADDRLTAMASREAFNE